MQFSSLFVDIPTSLVFDRSLNPHQKLIFSLIKSLEYRSGASFNISYFSKVLNIGRARISKEIKYLVSQKYILQTNLDSPIRAAKNYQTNKERFPVDAGYVRVPHKMIYNNGLMALERIFLVLVLAKSTIPYKKRLAWFQENLCRSKSTVQRLVSKFQQMHFLPGGSAKKALNSVNREKLLAVCIQKLRIIKAKVKDAAYIVESVAKKQSAKLKMVMAKNIKGLSSSTNNNTFNKKVNLCFDTNLI